MSLFHKAVGALRREMFIYYPGEVSRTPFKRCAITFLLDACSESDVFDLLYGQGLADFADRNDVILSFPVPSADGWNYAMDDAKEDDVAAFRIFQSEMTHPDDTPLETDAVGIPTVATMLRAWHPMNDARYLVGVGTGASMAFTLAARFPDNIAAVLTVGGELHETMLEKAVYAPIPVSMVSGGNRAAEYFIQANEAEKTDENSRRTIFKNIVNPLQCVVRSDGGSELDVERVRKAWDRMFSKVRRTNTDAHGGCDPRMDIKHSGLEFTIDDPCLDGNPHTWFTHVPLAVNQRPYSRYPLILFLHGGSDNPEEAAEMSKFHEIGDAEGFITIYPWGTNRCSWNSEMSPDLEDDVGFIVALIKHATEKYPVDPGRVYLSGFSNGAAMAQAFALAHPELIAAICPIDSNWPGDRFQESDLDWRDVRPFAIGMKKKAERDYRIPVWYVYGSREPAYPVYGGSTQQHQYDFWKMYNNIEITPTPGRSCPDPSGCGVPGEVSETLAPSRRHPGHEYDVQRFFSRDDPPVNLYNFVAMREKGHDIASMDASLGWNFVRQFRRSIDGGLELIGSR